MDLKDINLQLVVNHNRFIHHVRDAFFGTYSDTMIANDDPYPRSVAEGLYKDISYYLYDKNGVMHEIKGAYLITDGGYPQHPPVYIHPLHSRNSVDAVYWSEWLESVRKDVECTFGILKARFRFLKMPIEYHCKYTIECVFKSCCILHNMLILWNGNDLCE